MPLLYSQTTDLSLNVDIGTWPGVANFFPSCNDYCGTGPGLDGRYHGTSTKCVLFLFFFPELGKARVSEMDLGKSTNGLAEPFSCLFCLRHTEDPIEEESTSAKPTEGISSC